MSANKKILFLHPNYPGQFKQLVRHLSALETVEVKFLCLTDYSNNIKGIEKLIIKGSRGQQQLLAECTNELDAMKFRAESYRRAFRNLDNQGWHPDVVISHSGWGCGIHVKEIWPDCRFVAYMEWWFSSKSAIYESTKDNKFLNFNLTTQQKLWIRNGYISHELSTADKIVAPSHWQREQLPAILKAGCDVVYDGIDFDFFEERVTKPHSKPLITYGTRGMEPMRCFKEFIKCLPHLMRSDPTIEVEIIGEDKICYGGNQPGKTETWGKWAKRYVTSAGLGNRVRFLGRLSYISYREWLQRSWCHVYLTQPYVCSWSLLEAMACGTKIVASDSPSIAEFCEPANEIKLVDNNNLLGIVDSIRKTIDETTSTARASSTVARRDCLNHLSLQASLKGWEHVTGLDLNTRD